MHTDTTTRVLHVNGDPDLLAAVETVQGRDTDRLDVVSATDAREGLEALAARDVDCVVSAYDLPHRDGIEFLERVREDHPDLPFVLVAGTGCEALASRATAAGATGYVEVDAGPDRYAALASRIAGAVERSGVESELAFRTAVLAAQSEATIDGLLVVDGDRTILEYNDRFLDIWDLDEDAVEQGRDEPAVLERASDRAVDSERFLEQVESLYDRPDEESRDEFQLTDGRWIDRYTAPVVGDGGTRYGRLWVFRDVTERKEYERDLEQQRERLEEFAGIVSHDLRNPLDVAEGHLDLARESCESESLEAVARAHDRMRTLVDDLLALARANESITDPEPVALGDRVATCWGHVETRAAELRIETDRVIRADGSRLGQLLENLLRNAVEHGGADVTITVGDTDDGFYVEDTGVGIPADERDDVLESGYSTSSTGTGLGLAIVETVATAHGWELTVADAECGGARFEIDGVETH
jgi:signal transduction histidine kinase